MQYRNLGRHSPLVSEVGFGAWAIGGGWGAQSEQTSLEALHAAIDAGIRFIDTAAGYGNGRSEQLIAKVASARKESLFVATKIPPAAGPWPPSPYCRHEDRYSERHLRSDIEWRLKNLNVERIDLLQLHSWTRAWNDDPQPLLILQKLRAEGKIGLIGISTPEQDQNCVIQLMRAGLVDTIQIIYNLFEQEPAAQILPVAQETGTGVIVRVVFDEGVLTGKYGVEHQFSEDDFRHKYFEGDRLARCLARVDEIRRDMKDFQLDPTITLADVAIRFALSHSAVSSVITGIRSADQAISNAAASDQGRLPEDFLIRLRRHNWLRGVWYSGKA